MSDEEKKKDNWDKFSAVGPFLSGLIIAGIGLYFTQKYNAQQIRLNEIQTVERFIPRLLGTQEEEKLAIIAISAMGNTELATKLATRYPSQGTAAALETLSKTGSLKDQSNAKEALAIVQTELQERDKLRLKLVEEMFDPDKSTRIAATTKLIREWRNDEKVISAVLKQVNSNKDNSSGVINTLVLLENIDPNILKKFALGVGDFLESVKGKGLQTESHVNKVRAIIGNTATE